jgi:hypothetical protein
MCVEPGGTQKINLLHKAGGRVVYFGYKHQHRVEKGGQKRKKIERNTDVYSGNKSRRNLKSFTIIIQNFYNFLNQILLNLLFQI